MFNYSYMDNINPIFIILLLIFGVGCIYSPIIVIRRMKQKKIKLRSLAKKSSITILSILFVGTIISIISFYWLVDCYILDDAHYSFDIENAIENYGDFDNYKLLNRIDPEFSLDPIIIVQHNEEDLSVCMLKTRKMLIGLKRYWVRGGIPLVDGKKRFGYLIDENQINGGAILVFPKIWFGIIYHENSDKIRINGKVPNLHEINFNGTDYIFWYIEKDSAEARLSFE